MRAHRTNRARASIPGERDGAVLHPARHQLKPLKLKGYSSPENLSPAANVNKPAPKCRVGDTNHPKITRMTQRCSLMFRFEK